MSRKFITLELTEDEIAETISALEFSDKMSDITNNTILVNEIYKQLPTIEQRDKIQKG